MSRKRCGGSKSTFEDWGPLFQMSGSTAPAIEISGEFLKISLGS